MLAVSGALTTAGGATGVFLSKPGMWLIPLGVMLCGIALLFTITFYTSAGGLVNLLDKHTGYYDEQRKQIRKEKHSTDWNNDGSKV